MAERSLDAPRAETRMWTCLHQVGGDPARVRDAFAVLDATFGRGTGRAGVERW